MRTPAPQPLPFLACPLVACLFYFGHYLLATVLFVSGPLSRPLRRTSLAPAPRSAGRLSRRTQASSSSSGGPRQAGKPCSSHWPCPELAIRLNHRTRRRDCNFTMQTERHLCTRLPASRPSPPPPLRASSPVLASAHRHADQKSRRHLVVGVASSASSRASPVSSFTASLSKRLEASPILGSHNCSSISASSIVSDVSLQEVKAHDPFPLCDGAVVPNPQCSRGGDEA